MLNETVATIALQYDLEERERARLSATVKMVQERRIPVDMLIQHLGKRHVAKLRPLIRSILRAGITELLYMHQAAHAVCNEYVSLVKHRKMVGLSGFVNGILRRVDREREAMYRFIETLPVAARCGIPLWIDQMIRSEYGGDAADAFLQVRPEPGLRVRLIGDPMPLMKELASEGYTVTVSTENPAAVHIAACSDPNSLAAFRRGEMTVQDLSSTLPVLYLAPLLAGREAPRILDLCAAPGGKTAQAAEIPGARVTARDRSLAKVEKIRENIKRLHLLNVETSVGDAREDVPAFHDAFDAVICDLPCSGIGLIHRKPELRHRIQPEDIGQLSTLQRTILSQAVRYVRPGGFLVYSTCTVSARENEAQSAYLTGFMTPIGEAIQRIPGRDAGDGFYVAVFQRRETGAEKKLEKNGINDTIK